MTDTSSFAIEIVAVSVLALAAMAVMVGPSAVADRGSGLAVRAISAALLLVALVGLARAATAAVELGLRPDPAPEVVGGRRVRLGSTAPAEGTPTGDLAGGLATAVTAGITLAVTRRARTGMANQPAHRAYVHAVAVTGLMVAVLAVGGAAGGATKALAPSGGGTAGSPRASPSELTEQERGVADLVGNLVLGGLAFGVFAYHWRRRDLPVGPDSAEPAG